MLWVDGQISSSFFPEEKDNVVRQYILPDEIVTCEDVESNQMNFSMAVLPGLGGGHLHDLAGPVLDEED